MKKLISMLALGLLTNTNGAQAQMPYNVTTGAQPYTALTGATNINSTTPWTDTTNFSVPLGFNFKIGDKTTNKLNLTGVNILGSDTTGTIAGISFMGTSLVDRGTLDGTSKSPIRYSISGVLGKRICKLEFHNAGFGDENSMYSTLDDSLNMQVWLREDSNIIELRFGPSKITHHSDYFFFGGPMLGYVKNMDYKAMSFDKIYLLSGNPTAPTIDSATDVSISYPTLSAYPDSGTVYRFIPKNIPKSSLNTELAEATTGLKVYPTICTNNLFVENLLPATTYKIISLIGNTKLSGAINNGMNTVDVSMLPAGMYVMMVKSEDVYNSYKFIKQ